ncbi:MAG: hypothetical protein IJ524_03870 [Bacteroidales bacterium]|nr:hypothetical protein [Bacteroidales bacterium]
MKKTMMFLGLVFAVAGIANSQSQMSIKLGGAFPMGDFGEARVSGGDIDRWVLMDNSDKGGAGLGFSLGLENRWAVSSVDGLGVTLSLDAIYNGLNDDLNDFFEDFQDELDDEFSESSLATPKFINVPLMLGVNYSYGLTDNLSAFAGAGAGANLRLITPLTMEGSGRSYEYKESVKYDAAVSFAFRVGAGITIKNKYSLSLDYYALGSSKVKGELEEYEYEGGYTDRDTENIKAGKIAPTLLLLRLGIMF